MSNCKDCGKIIKDGYWRCYQCNLTFKENKNKKIEGDTKGAAFASTGCCSADTTGETTDETQINYYKFGYKKSKQDIRFNN